MNKQIEALKMAIKDLEDIKRWWRGIEHYQNTINACKEALAEAEKQEPVAWYGIGDMHVWKLNLEEDKDATLKVVNRPLANNKNWKPLYTNPATWQSLSDDEIWEFINKADIPADYDKEVIKIARAIEQALKELNAKK